MKTTRLFLIGAMALTLGACAEDEPEAVAPKSPQEAINFRPAMGSRATETTNANLSSIYVTALGETSENDLFANLEFKKGTGGFFESSPEYYWPGDDSELTFYAYAPSQDEMGADVTINESTKQVENFAVAEDIAQQVDFVTASATGKKSVNETSGVELDFAHQLSQIELRAKTDNNAYIVKVAGMRIGRPQYMATFDFGTSKWTLDDWHDTAVYESSCDTMTLSSTPVSIMGAAGNAMLMPQTLTPWSPTGDPDNVAREAYLSVLVNITSADGMRVYPFPTDTIKDDNGNQRTFAWVSIPLSGTWEQGKHYIYTLDFTNGAGYTDPDEGPKPGEPVYGDPIKFTVDVDNWAQPDTINVPMTTK